MKTIRNLLLEVQGQELTEYALLLAFVVIAAAALLINVNDNMHKIWEGANLQIIKYKGSL